MNEYGSLKETLSFYGIKTNEPYYVSTGNQIFELPKKPFKMDFYTFCICTSGHIEIEIDNTKYIIEENAFLVSAPSTIVRFVSHSENFRMKILFFENTFLLKNIANPFFIEKLDLFSKGSYTVCSADCVQSKHLFILLNYLYKQKDRTDRYAKDIIRTIIINLLLEISSVIEKSGKELSISIEQNNSNLYYKFLHLVQQRVPEQRSVQYYADQLFVSNKHLIAAVKKHSGKTPHQIINEALLKVTYVLLGNPEKNIVEIAMDLGFSSSSSFGRFLKKYASISPQKFRKQILK